jgi:hypothetical protein
LASLLAQVQALKSRGSSADTRSISFEGNDAMTERFMQISGTTDYRAAGIASGMSVETAENLAQKLEKRDELMQKLVDDAVKAADELVIDKIMGTMAGFGFDEDDPSMVSTRHMMRMLAVRQALAAIAYVIDDDGTMRYNEAGANAYLASIR